MEFTTDNKFTKERWELGKKLFFDPILSLDSSISCASCHKPSLAFSDDKARSPGIKNRAGKRNAPSLANIGYHPYFLREGGVPTLEIQVLVPIQEHNEFNHNIVEIGKQLEKIPEYVEMSKLAYDKKPDYFVITRALGVFERTLISGNSKYDKYLNKKVKFTKKEKQGMDLFFSDKTNCFTCHSGFNFTNYGFENTGLYLNYKDIGRMRFTKDTSDMARFKVPSLRNVSVTAPYMHNGSIATLKEVVEHFNSGGENHVNKSELIKPLNLSEEEKENLVLFMETLTDYEFIENDVLR
jgi:cytochrome c peroxidase